MHLHKTLSDGLSIGMLGLLLSIAPLRQVYAFAPQWRPVAAIPSGMVAASSVTDRRFRPIKSDAKNPLPLNSQTPVFTRQFAWRPAPSSWTPKHPMNVASGQHHPWQSHARRVAVPAIQGQTFAQNRWRPVEMPVHMATPGFATASAPIQASRHAWRPAAQPQVAQQTQPVVAQGVEYAATGYPYWPQPTFPSAVTAYHAPVQTRIPANWPYMPMPWAQVYAPGHTTAYVARQPMNAYAYPHRPLNAPTSPMPYYGHSSAMMRPRWVNGQVVWLNRRREDQHRSGLPIKRGDLATLPPRPLCAGCDS